jgi:hypothetical protein
MTRLHHARRNDGLTWARIARELERSSLITVLSGERRLTQKFRKEHRRARILGELLGLPDASEALVFHAAALKGFERLQRIRARKYLTPHDTDQLAVITKLATQGRIQALFIDSSRNIPAPKGGGTAKDDLLDDLAEQVLARDGRVRVLPPDEMPSTSPCVAWVRG